MPQVVTIPLFFRYHAGIMNRKFIFPSPCITEEQTMRKVRDTIKWKSTILFVLLVSFANIPLAEESPVIKLDSVVEVQNAVNPFDYFSNSWTVIGLKDYENGTRITPNGELVLADGSLCRPLIGKVMAPLNNDVKKTLRDGYLPMVKYDFTAGQFIRYELEMFAVSENQIGDSTAQWTQEENFLNLLRVQLSNVREVACKTYFGLEWTNKDLPIESVYEVYQHPRVRAIYAKDALLGLVHQSDACQIRHENNRVIVQVELEPKGATSFDFCIPFRPYRVSIAEVENVLSGFHYDECHERTISEWNDLLEQGTQFDIPETKPMETYKASLVNQFIGMDHGELHAGEGFYDQLYLRDAAYQAISLLHAGYPAAARKALECFLPHQNEDGQFITQKGQLDAHGYSLWALVEYYRLTRERLWLLRVYPALKKGVEWLQHMRRTETDKASPFYGILPNAIADGEYLWGGEYHILGYDWWNLRGLQSAAEAARALGYSRDAEEWENEFREYKQCIFTALKKTGLDYIPPSYEKMGTHWGNLEVIFPSPLLDPYDPLVTATLDEVRNHFGGGFRDGIIRWSPGRPEPAIHPYMSQFVTNTHIARGEYEQAIDGFYSFLLHTSCTHVFPEGVHYEKREAWNNTLPHLWAAALYVTTLRNMLVREQDDELHLLSAVPLRWLDAGKRLAISPAFTYFGSVGFELNAQEETIRLHVDAPQRNAPNKIVVHMPNGIEIIETIAHGESLNVKDSNKIVLEGEMIRQPFELEIKIRRNEQPDAMTFDAKVASFLSAVGN